MDEIKIIEILESQLGVKVEKSWKIFSWTSTIYIAIIGSMVAIKMDKKSLGDEEKIAISLVIIILLMYAYKWLRQNLNHENEIKKDLHSIFESMKKENEQPICLVKYFKPRPKDFKSKIKDFSFGYVPVIIGLGIIALLAVLYVKNPCL